MEVRLNVDKTKYGAIHCIYVMDSNTHGYQVVALKDISMSLSFDAT